MNSTSVDKTMLAEKDISSLPTTSTIYNNDIARAAAERRRAIMSRVQHICLLLLTIALLAVTLVNANAANAQAVVTDAQQFRQLLETIDDATLHEILHDHFKGKYKHGIFEEDKAALESLHRENAAAATSLVQLAKRQLNGTTITSTSVIETTQSITITSTSTPVEPPTTEPTLPPSDTTTEPPPPPPTTTTPPPVENTPTPTPTPSTSTPPVETTSSSTISSSSSTLITTTSSPTSSLATTSSRSTTSRRSSVTEEDVTTEVFYTTTLADGAQSVVTVVTVVPASQTTQIQRPTSVRPTDNASLQTGAANTVNQKGWTAGLGVMGMAMAWAL